nr:MAG TPA: hypothetical protein [Bacteriophage sp.]
MEEHIMRCEKYWKIISSSRTRSLVSINSR